MKRFGLALCVLTACLTGWGLLAGCDLITDIIDPPPPPPVEEYHYGDGPVTGPVDISGGWCEFDVYVPEAGRSTDWNRAEIFAVFDGQYHDKKTGIYSIHPYKIKACYGATCREPRYNLPWDRWRHVRAEWSRTSWVVTVDGERVVAATTAPWRADTRATFGTTPLLVGAKMRGLNCSTGL